MANRWQSCKTSTSACAATAVSSPASASGTSRLPTTMADVIRRSPSSTRVSAWRSRARSAATWARSSGSPAGTAPIPPAPTRAPLARSRRRRTVRSASTTTLCQPDAVQGTAPGPSPCETGCQRGGYPKVGVAYETGTYAGQVKMNKCTLCYGRAGADGVVDPARASDACRAKDRSEPGVSAICRFPAATRCRSDGPRTRSRAGVRLIVPGQGDEVGHQGQHPRVPQRSS